MTIASPVYLKTEESVLVVIRTFRNEQIHSTEEEDTSDSYNDTDDSEQPPRRTCGVLGV